MIKLNENKKERKENLIQSHFCFPKNLILCWDLEIAKILLAFMFEIIEFFVSFEIGKQFRASKRSSVPWRVTICLCIGLCLVTNTIQLGLKRFLRHSWRNKSMRDQCCRLIFCLQYCRSLHEQKPKAIENGRHRGKSLSFSIFFRLFPHCLDQNHIKKSSNLN